MFSPVKEIPPIFKIIKRNRKGWKSFKINHPKQKIWDAIQVFNKNGILENVVIIGSWAEYIYEESKILKNFEANLKTRDIDFLTNIIHKPRKRNHIIQI